MEEIINSIMQTPDNTNPNVLRSQLQGMASSGDGGVLVVAPGQGTALDKTWKEINAAPFAVLKSPASTGGTDVSAVTFLKADEGSYKVYFGDLHFTADSEDDYPVFDAVSPIM